jgi:hypothetical protein
MDRMRNENGNPDGWLEANFRVPATKRTCGGLLPGCLGYYPGDRSHPSQNLGRMGHPEKIKS